MKRLIQSCYIYLAFSTAIVSCKSSLVDEVSEASNNGTDSITGGKILGPRERGKTSDWGKKQQEYGNTRHRK
uniref:Lipoprotein n=1 Tax=Ornithodoros brasiliensis TaxID=888526 RepID=A0A1D2AIT9_ORNBR